MEHVEVVVIGAGLSGLSAARLLSKKGVKVVVLEATNRVGGRACTNYPGKDEPPYGWADMGGTFVSTTDVNIIPLCEELGVKTIELNCGQHLESILYDQGHAHTFYNWRRDLLWRNPVAAWDLAVMVRRLETMLSEIPVEKPWEAPQAREWDQLTVKEFLDRNCWTRFSNAYLSSVLRVLTASQESHMSLLYYLWELRIAKRRNHMLGWSNSVDDDQVMIEGGSQRLVDKMATDLDERVVLNQPVISITHGQEGVRVRTLNGREFAAKYVILSPPAGVHMKIHFEPSLTSMRSSLIQRSPLGVVMKCVLFYDDPFWEDVGMNGFVACVDPGETVSAVDAVHTATSKLFGLQCFILQDHAARLEAMSEDKQQEQVCQSLAKFFRSKKAFAPSKFISKPWTTEPYQYGGYTSFYPPGVLTSFGPAMRAPIGPRVFLAGTDTATYLRGSMSGAIDAGHRAAREVLHAEDRIKEKDIWVPDYSPKFELTLMEQVVPSIELAVYVFLAMLALGGALLAYYCTN